MGPCRKFSVGFFFVLLNFFSENFQWCENYFIYSRITAYFLMKYEIK